MNLSKRSIVTIVILVLVLSVLGFLTYSFIAPQGMFSGLPNDLKVLQPADIAAAYTDLDGKVVDLSMFKGKPMIINSWATWMPFSQTELPLLAQLQEKHGDAITVISINRMENIETIKSFMSIYAIPNTIVHLADPSDAFYKAIEGFAMPETAFYDKDGNIVAHTRGVLSQEDADRYLEALLAH